MTEREANQAAGEVLANPNVKRGGDRGVNQHGQWEANGKFPIATQVDRAESNGVSDRTQRKLDRLAKERPDLLARVKAGEMKVNRAAIEAGIVKKPTPLEKALKAYYEMDNI